MSLNRREFIILSAATLAGCQSVGVEARKNPLFDAGPATDYAADGVYDRYRDEGFFIIRNGPMLLAVSSRCTHRGCKLNAAPDHSFFCKCHGSEFTEEGKVTQGPATKDLPTLPTTIDANGHLIAHFPQAV